MLQAQVIKYFFTALTLVATIALVNAQPVIQAKNMPAPGFMAYGYSFNGAVLNAGDTGANQVWDFTAYADSLKPLLTPSMTEEYITVVNPSATPYGSKFPAANYCIEPNDKASGYTYFITDSSFFGSVARNIVGDTAEDNNNIFAKPRVFLKFPFSFRQVMETSWQLLNEPVMHDTITYDAYGTLKTPLGIYTNVARLTVHHNGDIKYKYWSTNPVFTIMQIHAGSGSLEFPKNL